MGSDPCSFAQGINDSGQVVGDSSPSDCVNYDTSRGFLWENGSIADLNTLIPSHSPLYVIYAYTINNRGEIAVNGIDGNGIEQAAVLIPCDENHGGVEGCDYRLIDGAEAARVSAARSPQQNLPAGTKLRGVRRSFRGPMEHTPTPSLPEGGRQAVSTSLGDDFGSVEKARIAREVSDESGRSAQHEADAEVSSCSTSERGASNGEVPARGYLVHGSCSVNEKANTLTGYCQGSISFSRTCARRDASQCPSGQKAKEPEWESCGIGIIRVDVKRPCEFVFQ